MPINDEGGQQSQGLEDTNNNIGPLGGDSNPLFESQFNEIQVYNTRVRKVKQTPHIAFILGHERQFGVLGSLDGEGGDTNRLGLGSATYTLFHVYNYNNTFEEEFNNDRFVDDLGGATLDTEERSLTF